ncbi:MAG: hypothetical protein ACI89X_003286 [Planctomycetota bacterium]|jgi:hypothetical protein
MFDLVVQLGVVLLTVLLIATATATGRRLGGRRLVRWMLLYAVAGFAAWGTARIALDSNWYWPLGLLTPVIASTIAATIALLLANKVFAAKPPAEPAGKANRAFGGLLGTCIGGSLAIATWLLLPLCVATPTQPDRSKAGEAQAAIADLCSIAHRGFLRHLPVVGNASDEVQALLEILRADVVDHRRIVDAFDLESIRDVPAMQAALDNPGVHRELQRLRNGSLLALFRLQRHPLVLAVAESDEVTERFGELLPTRIVAALNAGK